MNNEDKLNLKKMISANDVQDQTSLIRETKHSDQIKEQVKEFLFLKNKYQRLAKSNPNEFERICKSKCLFLYNNYTDIYNKIKKDEINLTILDKFLSILKQIEDGELDQHEGSFMVGKSLKELYIDSALKKSEKIDAINKKKKDTKKKEPKSKEITWKEYKEQNCLT
uniref:Uncharacterized protein n=1 Tax=viral metagenome TaxID=1070528 RepID=A0A6C0AYB1_9ZZZZ|tara:strand:+ start:1073 stop:1573 length:501 start_codon:yes stop_codon:yes gene_type:complete